MLKIIFVISLFLFGVGCGRKPPKPTKPDDSLCTFPNSLNKALSVKLKKECEDVTPEDLSAVKSLTVRNINKEETTALKKKYASYFKSLEELDVSNNPDMLSLPEFVAYLPNLKKLNISKTGIGNLPGEMCNLENSLTALIATHNNYEGQEIPIEVFCLSSLRVLDMSHSSLRYIDEYIGQLSHLEELYVSGNSLFLIPHMLSTLPHLTLVDFRNNNLKNKDLNSLQSCKSVIEEEKEECQEDLLDSIDCEAVHELPFQRGEPLRQMYTNLTSQSEELIMQQCEKDPVFLYCPSFITKCKDYPEYDKQKCMLDEFESPRVEERHRSHRDKCYIAWVGWLIDYDKSPELLNKTIRGKTIREIRYVSRYASENQSVFSCWEWPWENIRTFFGLIDNAPKKYPAHPLEVFPEEFREPGVASRVKSWSETDGTFNADEFYWVPEDCPHLPPNLKKRIERVAQERDQKYTEEPSNKEGDQ